MKPKNKKQTTKQNNQTQLIQSENLSFSCRQPHQLQRKHFIANFNLSSSASFKKITKNSIQTKQKLKVLHKPKNPQKNFHSPVQQKTMKIFQRSQNNNFFQKKKTQNNSSYMSVSMKSSNNSGEWIKLKSSYQLNQSSQAQQKEIPKQKDLQYQSSSLKQNQSNTMQNKDQYFSTSFEKFNENHQFQDFLQQNQSYLNAYNAELSNKQQKLIENFKSLSDQEIIDQKIQQCKDKTKIQSLKFQQQQSKITFTKDKESLSKQTKKLHESQTLKCSFMSTNKTNKNLRFSHQQTKEDKKYSKFKDLLTDQKQKKQMQFSKHLSPRQNKFQVKGNVLHDSRTKDSIQLKNYNKKELLPSHFSYKSQDNYIKKYQSMTSSPLKFMKSLKDLMQGSKGYQEHEYFTYQKMQRKLMYYNSNLVKQSSQKLDKDHEQQNEFQKQRQINYDIFIEELKKKKTNQQQKDFAPIKSSKTKQTQSLNNLAFCNQVLPKQSYKIKSLLSERTVEQKKSQFQPLLNKQFNKKNLKQVDENEKKQNIQNASVNEKIIFGTELIGLKFKKKQNKIKRLQQKLDQIRSIEKEFSLQNLRIDHQFFTKRAQRIERSKSKNIQTKR